MQFKPLRLIPIFLASLAIFATSERDLGPKPKLDWTLVSKKIVYLTNLERQMRALPMLWYNPVLTKAATIHSQYMAENQNMAHSEKVLSQPVDRVIEACRSEKEEGMQDMQYQPRKNGTIYLCCGENVLYHFDKNIARKRFFTEKDEKGTFREWIDADIHYLSELETAAIHVESWMNSPGHRANILHSDYGAMGAYAVDLGREEVYSTQVFSPFYKAGIEGACTLTGIQKGNDSFVFKLVKKETQKDFSLRAVYADKPDLVFAKDKIESEGFIVTLTKLDERISIRLELVDPITADVYYPLCQFTVFYKAKEKKITWDWKEWRNL